jgi:hypothetical protein
MMFYHDGLPNSIEENGRHSSFFRPTPSELLHPYFVFATFTDSSPPDIYGLVSMMTGMMLVSTVSV